MQKFQTHVHRWQHTRSNSRVARALVSYPRRSMSYNRNSANLYDRNTEHCSKYFSCTTASTQERLCAGVVVFSYWGKSRHLRV